MNQALLERLRAARETGDLEAMNDLVESEAWEILHTYSTKLAFQIAFKDGVSAEMQVFALGAIKWLLKEYRL